MSPATYAYYPGCALHSTAKEYDVSTKLVTRALGIELWELEDWICCGASSAHTISKPISISLPSYELLKASKQGLPLVTSCAMCFSRLKFSAKEIEDPETREMVGQVLGGEPSTLLLYVLPDLLGNGPVVEGIGSALGNGSQGPGQRRHPYHVPLLRGPPVEQ